MKNRRKKKKKEEKRKSAGESMKENQWRREATNENKANIIVAKSVCRGESVKKMTSMAKMN